jgi:ferric hydroxamate transport system ATP-binding protein
MPEPVFRLQGAGVRIDRSWLLHPLDLAIASGRVTGLIGHNGSGKSTLLKLLARQLAPSCGRVLHAGRPLGGFGARELARRIAYMPQESPQTDALSVRELVALGRYPWHGALGRFSAADRAAVARAIEATGLEPLQDHRVDTLSGGERQRAMLAMLLAQEAECLLLDEPISALDIPNQIAVMRLIRAAALEGRSVVVVLHDVNIAARFCDDLIALSAASLVAQAPARALMTEAALEGIYGIRMGLFEHPETALPVSYVY